MSSPTRETLVQALAAVHALEAQAASIRRAVESALALEVTSTPLPAYCHANDADLWQLQALAREFHIDEVNLRRWTKKNKDLGKKIGGRWWVYRSRLKAMLGMA